MPTSDNSKRAAGRALAKMLLVRWTSATLCWKTVGSAISYTRTPYASFSATSGYVAVYPLTSAITLSTACRSARVRAKA